jgi:hypothetical protein
MVSVSARFARAATLGWLKGVFSTTSGLLSIYHTIFPLKIRVFIKMVLLFNSNNLSPNKLHP